MKFRSERSDRSNERMNIADRKLGKLIKHTAAGGPSQPNLLCCSSQRASIHLLRPTMEPESLLIGSVLLGDDEQQASPSQPHYTALLRPEPISRPTRSDGFTPSLVFFFDDVPWRSASLSRSRNADVAPSQRATVLSFLWTGRRCCARARGAVSIRPAVPGVLLCPQGA